MRAARGRGQTLGAPDEISLPELAGLDGVAVETHGDYDAVAFEGLDLTDQNANNANFLDCRLERCRLDGLLMRRTRVVECLLADLQAVSLDLSESVWRDCLMTGGRVGVLTAPAAKWARVRVRGAKLDFVNFRGAQLLDVVFEGCVIADIDFADAQLTRVEFLDCVVDDLNLGGAALSRVDLSGATLRMLRGLGSLRGAVVSQDQLLDLAPLLAAHLGLEVRAQKSRPTRA
jgi:uncharacterized protein YjbI with pentapeptide repeats